MKRAIFLQVVSILVCLTGTAAAQQTIEQKAESDRRMAEMMKGVDVIAAHTRAALAKCPSQPETYQYPDISFDLQKSGDPVMRPVVISVTGWTGQCVDGKRDGKGVLSWTVERTSMGGSTLFVTRVVSQMEGSFVKGERLGLWCIEDWQTFVNGKPGSHLDMKGNCMLLTESIGSATSYRKTQDGRWQLWAATGP